jgi:hypothetical protein
MTTLEAVDQAIADTLKNDAQIITLCGGRVHREQSPQNAQYPCIIFGVNSARDRNMLGPVRAFTRGVYFVKAVTQGPGFDTAGEIMSRVDDLLQDKQVTVEGVRVMPLFREELFRYTETVSGVRFNHYGFIYRFFSYAL